MRLFVRSRSGIWITFVHDTAELKEFVANYIPGRRFVIGDLALFNNTMLNILLKFIEENSLVDCYSSQDIMNPILLSRFVEVVKEPISVVPTYSPDEFQSSARDYISAQSFLEGWSTERKLRAPLCRQSMLKLLMSV